MSMMNLLAILYVVVIAGLIGAMVWRVRRERSAARQVAQRNSTFLGQGETFQVGLLRSSDLERPASAMRSVQKGTLTLGSHGARFAGAAPASVRDVLVDFEGALVAELPKPWYGMGIPGLVRLSTREGSQYVFARSALGQPSPRETRRLFGRLSTRLRKEPHAPSTPSTPFLAYVLVGLAMAGILGGAVYSYPDRRHTGPLTIASHPEEGVVAATQQEILRFNSNGELVEQRPFKAIGLQHAPAHLAFAPDGELYASDPDAGAIMRCGHLDALSCKALPEPLPAASRPDGAFKFAFNPDGSRLVVSIAGQDSLLVLDRSGHLESTLDGAHSGLCFPNGLAFGQAGHLFVVDTNNFRVAEFALDQDMLRRVGEHSVVASRTPGHGRECQGTKLERAVPRGRAAALPGARDGRVWPVALAQTSDGTWWVTLASGKLDKADVAAFPRRWGAPTVHTLGDRADLTTLAAWDGSVWAADNRLGIRVLQPDSGARPLAAMDGFMRQVQSDKQRVALRHMVGLTASMLILMLALFAAARANQKRIARILQSEPTVEA